MLVFGVIVEKGVLKPERTKKESRVSSMKVVYEAGGIGRHMVSSTLSSLLPLSLKATLLLLAHSP